MVCSNLAVKRGGGIAVVVDVVVSAHCCALWGHCLRRSERGRLGRGRFCFCILIGVSAVALRLSWRGEVAGSVCHVGRAGVRRQWEEIIVTYLARGERLRRLYALSVFFFSFF